MILGGTVVIVSVARWFVHSSLLPTAKLGTSSMLKLIIGNH